MPPASLAGRAETIVLVHPGDSAETRFVLHVWPAPYRIEPGARPLWIGSVQTMRFNRQWNFVSYWLAQADDANARAALRDALSGSALEESAHSDSRTSVLRFTLPEPAAPSPPSR